MKQHIAKVTSKCFYHLRRIRQVRRRVGMEATIQLVLALVMSSLDYCNATLAGVPQTTLQPLQRVQNAAVRLVLGLGVREHVTPGLMQLHWLPVRWRIQYKLCCLMHAIHTSRCPAYLANIVSHVSDIPFRSGLRSGNSTDFFMPRLSTKFGERAFSHAGPAAWNALPGHIQSTSDSANFRQLLKTYFFTTAFN